MSKPDGLEMHSFGIVQIMVYQGTDESTLEKDSSVSFDAP